MEQKLEITEPYVARCAWLAAILAAPAWTGKDGKPTIRTVALYARLAADAVASSWSHSEDEEIPRWDRIFDQALELAETAGAPSSPEVEYNTLGRFARLTHNTRNDRGSTKVELSFPEPNSGRPFVLTVSGDRAEAVARRFHAAALHIENVERGAGAPLPAVTPDEPEAVRYYEEE